MTRYHATPNGHIPFTSNEEAEWDAREAEWEAGAAERKAAEVRAERNALIAKSDWMALFDVTMPDEWRTYRQDLRDVPEQVGFPDDITWPAEPTAPTI